MQLFFNDVGREGAERDFPLTIYREIAIPDIVQHIPTEFKAEVERQLLTKFPDGRCNAWGVPEGAKSVIKNLHVGDVMLLIRTVGGENGDIPVACIVRAYWRQQFSELSDFLWGSGHYPFIFFFETVSINLTWTKFKRDVGYASNFRPSGNVYRVKPERLLAFGGAQGYVEFLLSGGHLQELDGFVTPPIPAENTPDEEYKEGRRLVSERKYFQRNPQLVAAAKDFYGYVCAVCGFDFEATYGELGAHYIECHHHNPLAEREDTGELGSTTLEDVTVLCSNCHRMIHRRRPALTVEELKNQMGVAQLD